MDILYISSSDPRKIDAGYAQRTHLIWESLKELGTVYTIVYDYSYVGIPTLYDEKNPIYICNPKLSSPLKRFKAFGHRLLNYFTGIPYSSYKQPCEYEVNDVFRNVRFNIVVSRYIQLSARFHLWDIAPLYIDIDDHPLQVYDTIIQYKHPAILRSIGRHIVKRQFNSIIKKVAGAWISNEQQIVSNKILSYLPNIPFPFSSTYSPRCSKRDYLFTVGFMSYKPNYEGVDFFLSAIWPEFHKKYPNIKYLIGGKGAPLEFVNKWERIEGVQYLGYIDNLEAAYENCIAAIVPIYSGAGTCIKTLEAMSYYRVCLSTPYGARGIDKADLSGDHGLFIFNDAKEFIRIYENIINYTLRSHLEEKASEYIKSNYSFTNFKKIIISTIENKSGARNSIIEA
jgi:hypothetical protein